MTTRRHQESKALHEQKLAELVASCLSELQPYADKARYYLVFSSVFQELANARDKRDLSLGKIRSIQRQIDGLIHRNDWDGLRQFVEAQQHPDVFIVDSLAAAEAHLKTLWERLSGFGVGIASDVAWLDEPKVCYLLLWKD